MAELQHVNDGTFETEVLKSELPVLVDFWAPWCGPCRMLGPVVESLAARYAGKLKVVKVNTDESPATPGRYNVNGIPALIMFKGGKDVDRSVGYRPEAELATWINTHVT